MNKRTTITVYESTKMALIKVRGMMEQKNGKPRTTDSVIQELIKHYEMRRDEDPLAL
jgi:hypothetical protein